MADDLDDEWWLKDDASGEKQSPDVEENSDSDDPSGSNSDDDEGGKEAVKRKHSDTESEKEEIIDEEEKTEESEKKKKKRKRKKISEILANEKPSPLFPHDLTSALQKHFEGKLSPIEMDEIQLEDDNFTTCNDGTHNTVSYLKFIIPKWKKVMKNMTTAPGSPALLVICAAGLRAANLTREISSFKGEEGKVAKLFAKHIKLQEQIKFLKSRVIHIGVGTPNRIQALIENEALSLDQVKYIVIDWSHRDVKYRRIGDIAEIRKDLYMFLSRYLIRHVKEKKAKLALL